MYTVKPISSGTMFKVVGFQISNLFFAQNTVIPQSSGCGHPSQCSNGLFLLSFTCTEWSLQPRSLKVRNNFSSKL